jgi:sulfite reductase beta subunit-like hemoprotein
MSIVDDARTLGRARLTFASEAEIDEFVTTVEKYERGEITPDQWRAYRLVRGTYGQRQAEDAQMLRVKIPQGVLTDGQLLALAEVMSGFHAARAISPAAGNVQFHPKLHDEALRRLAGGRRWEAKSESVCATSRIFLY